MKKYNLEKQFFLENKTHGEVFHYRHDSGAQVVVVQNDDEENFFCFGFRTPPLDNKGTAHILEHTVLCGSQNYPIKDPFLSLLKGSMQTFLNAMTYPDKTLYPAASPLKKDFFNLMSVYGDAVFFPLLKEEAFRQEAHRLELDGKQLKRVGIVYNEMKGVYSSFENFAYDKSLFSLFKNNCYRYDSGGNPSYIPELTYQEFVDFHKLYYHPSNCKIFLYGNIDLDEKLNFLDARFLSHFDAIPLDSSVENEPAFKNSIREEFDFASDSDDDSKATVSVNFLLNDSSDYKETLSLRLLTYILLASDGSPFYMALQNSRLGEDVSPISGFSDSYKQNIFVAALREVDELNVDKVETLVLGTLQKIAIDGITNDEIESALRSIELSSRRVKSGPMGLHLMSRLYKDWNYDLDIKESFYIDKHLSYLRNEAFKVGFFQTLLEKYFIKNNHRSLVITRPSKVLYKKEQEAEKNAIKNIYNSLTDQDIQKLKEEALSLKNYQNSIDKSGIAPKLTRSDAPLVATKIDFKQVDLDGRPLVVNLDKTNGLYNFKIAFNVNHLSNEELNYLPFLSHVIDAMGWEDGTSYDHASRLIDLHAGDLSFALDNQICFDNKGNKLDKTNQYLVLSLGLLKVQLSHSIGIIDKIFNFVDFSDLERLKDLFMENYLNLKNDIVPSANSYIAMYLSSLKSYSAFIDSNWHGIDQFLFLDKIKNNLSNNNTLLDVSLKLKNLSQKIFNLQNASFSLLCENNDEQLAFHTILQIKNVISNKPLSTKIENKGYLDFIPTHKKVGFSANSLVNYVGIGLSSSNILTIENASEKILCQHLNAGALWEELRMKGGAYGASLQINSFDNTCNFTSYRDPNLIKTLDAFKQIINSFSSSDFNQSKLDDALIAVVGKELKPLSPTVKNSLAFRRFLYNSPENGRQINLDNLFKVTIEDVILAAKRLSIELGSSSIAILSSKDSLENAKKQGIIDEIISLF